MTTQPKFADRDMRQRYIVPPEQLKECSASVIGCGAVGRQVALQLAAMGMPHIHLVDFDIVSEVNLAPQGFREADIGLTKVSVTACMCQCINSAIKVRDLAERFTPNQPLGDIVFCCVDSMNARANIWKHTKRRAKLFLDSRISAEVVRIITAVSPADNSYYETTLYSDQDAYQDTCTARSTIFCANIAAGLLLEQFSKYLRNMPIDPDFALNLLANEITLAHEYATGASK